LAIEYSISVWLSLKPVFNFKGSYRAHFPFDASQFASTAGYAPNLNG